jgi:ribonucleoside-diphosphate reductase beta chain
MGILDPRPEMLNKMLHTQKYPWAREIYKDSVANNWTPEEVQMLNDREQWMNGALTPEEKNMVIHNLSLFATAEALTQDNIAMALLPFIQDGFCRQYLIRQAFEEALHTDSFLYVCDSLGLDLKEIYEGYYTIPSIKEKDDFLMDFTKGVNVADIDINTVEGKQALFRNIVGFGGALESINFYGNFAQIMSLGKMNKMNGLAKEIEYILRDENNHVKFAFLLLNTIKSEYPEMWTSEFQKEIRDTIAEFVRLENNYTEQAIQEGMLGLKPEEFEKYIKYTADRRLKDLGLEPLYNVQENPFPWLESQQQLQKETNFFESKPTEYQTKELEW